LPKNWNTTIIHSSLYLTTKWGYGKKEWNIDGNNLNFVDNNSKLLKIFWAEALMTTTYLQNQSSPSAI